MSSAFYVLIIFFLFSIITHAVPTPLDPQSFSLTTDMTSLSSALSSLNKTLAPSRCTVSEVMDLANRERQSLCHSKAYSPLSTKSGSGVVGFCWQEGDDNVDYWYPQGITSTHDAYEAGQYDDHQLILSSWYHIPDKEGDETPNKGVRVTFTDWDADWPNTYRHVLLVVPVAGSNYTAVKVHAGGIMWYGNLLYVADTSNGLRIFDMDNIYEVDASNSDVIGKQSDGKYYAFGYKYIIPQVGWANNSGVDFRYSFVSLDRATTPDSLIVGEYSPPSEDDKASNTRIVRFSLDFKTRLPLNGADSKTYATEAYNTGIVQMQGALARDGRFWFGSSNGEGSGPSGHYGYLRVWDRNTSDLKTYDWAYGSEDMSYWGTNGTDRIWTLTEHPGWRVVLSVPTEEWQ